MEAGEVLNTAALLEGVRHYPLRHFENGCKCHWCKDMYRVYDAMKKRDPLHIEHRGILETRYAEQVEIWLLARGQFGSYMKRGRRHE